MDIDDIYVLIFALPNIVLFLCNICVSLPPSKKGISEPIIKLKMFINKECCNNYNNIKKNESHEQIRD